ncbi:MAG: hypothetical protein Q4G54_07090 [Pelistega sp.]|nr:hypothetical protein [Pelistega sp.]
MLVKPSHEAKKWDAHKIRGIPRKIVVVIVIALMALRICFTYMFASMFYALIALNHLLPYGLVGSD